VAPTPYRCKDNTNDRDIYMHPITKQITWLDPL
jgi:hypothetical protein